MLTARHRTSPPRVHIGRSTTGPRMPWRVAPAAVVNEEAGGRGLVSTTRSCEVDFNLSSRTLVAGKAVVPLSFSRWQGICAPRATLS